VVGMLRFRLRLILLRVQLAEAFRAPPEQLKSKPHATILSIGRLSSAAASSVVKSLIGCTGAGRLGPADPTASGSRVCLTRSIFGVYSDKQYRTNAEAGVSRVASFPASARSPQSPFRCRNPKARTNYSGDRSVP
jgi:hypothetical protein